MQLAEGQTERAYAAAPEYFGRLPSANCVVKAVEEYRERETPPAFYMQPSLDGSRQGQYYINTYQPEERPLHKLAAITFHEATPGHHFQIAIEMELTGLPRVPDAGRPDGGRGVRRGLGTVLRAAGRRDGPVPGRRERLGMLDAQAFRASRLVVDSGLHAMGWTREQAIAVHARARLAAAWSTPRSRSTDTRSGPGQALAYKIGQREIERARREVSEKMGDRFDLRAFHDEVLGHGTLPPGHPATRDPGLGRGRRRRAARAPSPGEGAGARSRWPGVSSGWSRWRSGIATTCWQRPRRTRRHSATCSRTCRRAHRSGMRTWPMRCKAEYVSWATVDHNRPRRWVHALRGHRAGARSVEIGWTWIAPSHQRTATNTEAKLLQLTYAFDELGATRVAFKTDRRNCGPRRPSSGWAPSRGRAAAHPHAGRLHPRHRLLLDPGRRVARREGAATPGGAA